MRKDNLYDRLNRHKIFVIRYAFIINIIITIGIICLLYFLKIDNNSVLSLVVKYYFDKK